MTTQPQAVRETLTTYRLTTPGSGGTAQATLLRLAAQLIEEEDMNIHALTFEYNLEFHEESIEVTGFCWNDTTES